MVTNIPLKQQAIQLTAPDELVFNSDKSVHPPGPYQLLCSIEAVGLCFSDLKLLKQFSAHPRKKSIKSGIDLNILDEIPSYAPDELPTVPGHEAVVRIEAVGANVAEFSPGERYLVQTDYRWLPTDGSNASFGYDFEGGLQEYVLMDTRIITSPEGESMLIPASSDVSASAIALVEPWACVENSYASKERIKLDVNGKMLIVSDIDLDHSILEELFAKYGSPSKIFVLAEKKINSIYDFKYIDSLYSIPDNSINDIIYFGSNAQVAESLFPKLGARGLINLVQCGSQYGRKVKTPIGRVHYGGIRIIGTTGFNPSESMNYIPLTGEIRQGEKINVIGAGGPMGMMHVIRNICQGVSNISVYASDLNTERLEVLKKIAAPLAKERNVLFTAYNPKDDNISDSFSYSALMVPVAALVSQEIESIDKKGIINIFAGIPAQIIADLDIDKYIEKKLYFIGTSGSVLEDMKAVLYKVESAKQLDTNLSVAAISGLDGAIEGIRAVEHQLIAGKIIVYPSCKGMGLITLDKLADYLPGVADKLSDGLWTKDAEDALLKHFSS